MKNGCCKYNFDYPVFLVLNGSLRITQTDACIIEKRRHKNDENRKEKEKRNDVIEEGRREGKENKGYIYLTKTFPHPLTYETHIAQGFQEQHILYPSRHSNAPNLSPANTGPSKATKRSPPS